MSNFANLVALIGAGVGGYAKGVQSREDEQRRQSRDAREQAEFDYQQEQRDKKRALDRDLEMAQKDIQPEQGITTTGTNLYTNPEDAATDNRELQRFSRQQTENTGTGFGVQPPKEVYRVGKQMVADAAAVPDAMLGVNSRAAKYQRAADVMSSHGEYDKARALEKYAEQHISEGTDKALSSILGAAPSVDTIKKANGTIDGTVGKDVADVYNKTGGLKVSPDAKVQYYVDKDAAGREVVNARVLGSDGKPILSNARNALLALTDIKTRLEQQHNDTKTYQTGQQLAELSRHNQTEEGIQNRKADTEASRVGIAKQELEWKKANGGGTTELTKNVNLLKGLGYGDGEIKDFIFNRKEMSIDDLAAKFMTTEQLGERMTPQKAAQAAVELRAEIAKTRNQAPKLGVTPPPATGDRPPLSSFMK